MKSFFYIALAYTIVSCQNHQENKTDNIPQNAVNEQLNSLYPLNGKWLELQNLQWVNEPDENRNFKNTGASSELKTLIYTQLCAQGKCIQFNALKILEVIPQESLKSEAADKNALNFFIPVKDGWLTCTSLPDENIYTIRLWDSQLHEKWNTIYEHSRPDSNSQITHYAQILGYNDNILAFNSSSEEIRKSGYINLNNGLKKQEEAQWTGLLIDSDQQTVLGQLIRNEDLSYSLMIGNRLSHLPQSVTGYTESRVFISGNNIFSGFFYPQNNTLKLMAIDYHSGAIKWEQSLTSAKSIKDVILSAFDNLLTIEISSSPENHLYVLQQENGNISGKF